MKSIFILAFSIFLFSCQSAHEQSRGTTSSEVATFQPDSAKQRLLKIIEGGWVNEEYINVLVKYKSPMIAAGYGLPVQQLNFNCSNLSGDTLLNAIARLELNEGEQFDVVFYKREDGKTGMKAVANRNNIHSNPLLNYSIEGKDTVLLLNFLDGKISHTSRFRRQFRQVGVKDEITLTAMECLVNEVVFEGNWKLLKSKIVFSKSGQVENFETFYRYSVLTMDEHPASKADEISFYNDSAAVTYAFTVNTTSVNLYEIQESDDGKLLTRGKLIGELKRN